MRLDALGLAFIRHEEGNLLFAYDDADDARLHWTGSGWARPDGSKPKGNPTIGTGHLLRPGEHWETVTLDFSEELLRKDIADVEAAVNRSWPAANQNQFNAGVDLGFNNGWGVILPSGIGAAIARGDSLDSIKPLFVQYCHSGKDHHVNPVLVGRRARGWAMFCKPVVFAWSQAEVDAILASVHATAEAETEDFRAGSPLPDDAEPPTNREPNA